jgi:hypothetical protein
MLEHALMPSLLRGVSERSMWVLYGCGKQHVIIIMLLLYQMPHPCRLHAISSPTTTMCHVGHHTFHMCDISNHAHMHASMPP